MGKIERSTKGGKANYGQIVENDQTTLEISKALQGNHQTMNLMLKTHEKIRTWKVQKKQRIKWERAKNPQVQVKQF